MDRGTLPPFSTEPHPGCIEPSNSNSVQTNSFQATQDRMKITSLLHSEDTPPILPKNDFKCLPFFNQLLQDSPSTTPNPYFAFSNTTTTDFTTTNVSQPPFVPQMSPWNPISQQLNAEPTRPVMLDLERIKRKSEDSGSSGGEESDPKKSKSERMFKVPKNRPKNGAFERQWMEHFEQLKEFKQLFGHTNVTRSTKGYGNLGNWLAEQRRKLRRGKLIQRQYDLLESLGVEWDRSHYFLPKVYADQLGSSQ